MIGFDGASLLLQWATGGLLFLWVTTRRREVSLGYGWLMRGVYAVMAAGAFAVGVFLIEPLLVRDLSSLGVALAATVALVVSVMRRAAGVSRGVAEAERRTARVAAMTGIEREPVAAPSGGPEFPPSLDLVAPVIGAIGVVAAGLDAGGPTWLAVSRFVVGAAFLGAVTDAMLLGHWYLVTPKLSERPLTLEIRMLLAALVVQALLFVVWTTLGGGVDQGPWEAFSGSSTLLVLLRGGITILFPIILVFMALRTAQTRSMESATGLLYINLAAVLAGTIGAAALYVSTGLLV